MHLAIYVSMVLTTCLDFSSFNYFALTVVLGCDSFQLPALLVVFILQVQLHPWFCQLSLVIDCYTVQVFPPKTVTLYSMKASWVFRVCSFLTCGYTDFWLTLSHGSRGWFRSIDLWVMGPALSRSTTLRIWNMEWHAWQKKALEPFLVEVAKDSIREAQGPFKMVESELGYRKGAAASSL